MDKLFQVAILSCGLGILFGVAPFCFFKAAQNRPVEKLPEKETNLSDGTGYIYSYYHHGHLWVVYRTTIVHHPDCVCLTKLP